MKYVLGLLPTMLLGLAAGSFLLLYTKEAAHYSNRRRIAILALCVVLFLMASALFAIPNE